MHSFPYPLTRLRHVSAALTFLLVCAAGALYSQTPDSFNPGANRTVNTLAVQLNGEVLAGGDFTVLGGSPRAWLGRLTGDGALDTSFSPGLNGSVYSLAVQPDGKVLVGGGFTTLGGQSRVGLGRLNCDGSLDAAFNAGVGGSSPSVHAMAVQADDKILLGGFFTMLGGTSCNYLGRLNADGSRDTNFNAQVDGSLYSLAVQEDGKIVVGGGFSTLGGQPRKYIGRLNGDGTLDTNFTPPQPNFLVRCVAVQADGKILLGGDFSQLDAVACSRVARLNTNGTLDTSFHTGVVGPVCPIVDSLALQADGTILVGGWFYSLGGRACTNVGRLFGNGGLDPNFNPGATGSSSTCVYALGLQGDGKLLVTGPYINMLGGQARTNLGRLNNAPATQSLAFDSQTITWLRGGTSPEVWRTGFEVFINGSGWARLADGIRVPGGWQLSGIALPPNATIRARGLVAGGYHNGSGWLVETTAGGPAVAIQPASRTNAVGTATTFTVGAAGSGPLSFQWRKDGMDLVTGGNAYGVQTATLDVTNLTGADAGGYSVIISNSFGCVTSLVARLTVLDPLLSRQPVTQTANIGQCIVFSAEASASPPFITQWFKDGAALEDGNNVSGARTPSLTVSNVSRGDVDGYFFVISNAYDCLTSQVASLRVADPSISSQPANATVFSGQTAAFSVGAAGTAPLWYQWRKGGTNIAGATGPALIFAQVRNTDRGNYQVVVSNPFGCVTSTVALLTVNPVIEDPAFTTAFADNSVSAFATQPDGRIVLGGSFTSVDGESHPYLARINPDGSVDSTFNPATDDQVYCLALQEDGKIVVGGMFTTLCGKTHLHLGRLNPDGSLDETFTAQASGEGPYAYYVNCLALQPDGKILVGGGFATLAGQTRNGIARLNPDGTLDADFNPGCDGTANCLVVQPDGKIVVGGVFTLLARQPRSSIGRLQADGMLDTDFAATATGAWYFNPSVTCLALQGNGQILVGGNFWGLSGQERYALGRLNPDGTCDSAFNPGATGGADLGMYSLLVQTDGKILAGGPFLVLAGQSCAYVGRLNSDGTLDTTFNAEVGNDYLQPPLALQADGLMLLGGYVNATNGEPRYLGRLKNTDPATQQLLFDGCTVSWLRDGTGPEVWCAKFAASTNGSDWFDLGMGTRFPQGWQLNGVVLATNATLRARGLVSGSGSIVESQLAVDPKMPPQMLPNGGSNSDCFGFKLAGLTGQAVLVQVSTNLADWTVLSTNTLVTGRASFTDPQSPFFNRRFYRLVLRAD